MEENVKDESIQALEKAIFTALEDKKAMDPLIIDIRGRSSEVDHFVIASGNSDRHLKAMADAVSEVAHRYGLSVRMEGLEAMEWLLIDLGDVVVHLFLPEVRSHFQLENLWAVPREATQG